MRRCALVLLLTAASLHGCGWVRVPPDHGRPAAAPAVPAVDASADAVRIEQPPGGIVTVERGDTVYSIARRYGVPVRGFIRLNGLQPPYRLLPGDRLQLPPASAIHTVSAGETLYGISRRYGVDMARLVRDNDLAAAEPIVPGQKLIIPEAAASVAGAAPPAMTAPAAPVAAVESVPLPPLPLEPGRDGPAQPPAVSPPPPPAEPPGVAALPKEPAARRSGPTFLKPVDGQTLSAYGPKSGGLHNDGINIAAPRGTVIRAAADGTVAYVGNELPGFGNLVLIKHSDGWITAYGHSEDILVAKGQTVKRGQPIAHVGSSGNVSRPQVHFEIRQGARAVDPTPYLVEAPRRAAAIQPAG